MTTKANATKRKRGADVSSSDVVRRFVVQEKGNAPTAFWYDHPYLQEYANENMAIEMMNREKARSSVFTYRVIKRIEAVVA